MYGLVNRAIEELILARYNADTWDSIKQEAGIEIDSFLSMEAYPDHLTYRLIDAAASITGMSFGEYWVLYTAQHGYGELLSVVRRPGLAPMVLGLLRGLGRLFRVERCVVHSLIRGEESDHDEFMIYV